MSLSSELQPALVTVVSSPLTHTHTPAAKSLAELVQTDPRTDRQAVEQLLKQYRLLYKVGVAEEGLLQGPCRTRQLPFSLQDISPLRDELGRVLTVGEPDPWEGRMGVARALEHLSVHLTSAVALHVLLFMIPQGLGDRHSDVRAAMLGAGLAILDTHGQVRPTATICACIDSCHKRTLHHSDCTQTPAACQGDLPSVASAVRAPCPPQGLSAEVMRMCEEFLSRADDSTQTDLVRKSVVVLMGTMAKHLDQADPKVGTIVHQLLANLDTPSQAVQEAVSSCLPPLMAAMKDEAQEVIDALMEKVCLSVCLSV